MVRRFISKDQLKHHVRRVTLGAQETFRLVQLAIEELKGPAGLDESGVSIFKSPGMENLILKNYRVANIYNIAHKVNITHHIYMLCIYKGH